MSDTYSGPTRGVLVLDTPTLWLRKLRLGEVATLPQVIGRTKIGSPVPLILCKPIRITLPAHTPSYKKKNGECQDESGTPSFLPTSFLLLLNLLLMFGRQPRPPPPCRPFPAYKPAVIIQQGWDGVWGNLVCVSP